MTTIENNLLERTLRRTARSPSRSRRLAEKRLAEAHAKAPGASILELKSMAAKKIVRGHAARSGVAGAVTGATGFVPGPMTAVAATAAAATDVALQMKVLVDMCQAMVYVYKPELDDAVAFSMAVSLACDGTLEKHRLAREVGGYTARVASQAGVRILRQQLRGGTLIVTRQALKRVGIVFTRKAVEKAIPFGVGAIIGATVNSAITTYVGQQARKHLEIDAVTS